VVLPRGLKLLVIKILNQSKFELFFDQS